MSEQYSDSQIAQADEEAKGRFTEHKAMAREAGDQRWMAAHDEVDLRSAEMDRIDGKDHENIADIKARHADHTDEAEAMEAAVKEQAYDSSLWAYQNGALMEAAKREDAAREAQKAQQAQPPQENQQ